MVWDLHQAACSGPYIKYRDLDPIYRGLCPISCSPHSVCPILHPAPCPICSAPPFFYRGFIFGSGGVIFAAKKPFLFYKNPIFLYQINLELCGFVEARGLPRAEAGREGLG